LSALFREDGNFDFAKPKRLLSLPSHSTIFSSSLAAPAGLLAKDNKRRPRGPKAGSERPMDTREAQHSTAELFKCSHSEREHNIGAGEFHLNLDIKTGLDGKNLDNMEKPSH